MHLLEFPVQFLVKRKQQSREGKIKARQIPGQQLTRYLYYLIMVATCRLSILDADKTSPM